MVMGEKATELIASRAPHWAALIIIVIAFLIYMERQAGKSDRIADQRIETCHRMQEDSMRIMAALNQTITDSGIEDARLHKSIEDMLRELRLHIGEHAAVRGGQ